ncbi:hypothetical protein TNCV_2584831 [Trichonephila clavipes]|nr:hypothetical protein TNCV_2584831 [Trichonephila clavipes]
MEVIDGKAEKPESIDADAQESVRKQHKERCDLCRKNSYAKSMIASTVTDAVSKRLWTRRQPFEAWESLRKQFEATSKDQLFKFAQSFLHSAGFQERISPHTLRLRSL